TWQELQRWAEVEIAALTAAESVAAAVAGTTAPVAASLIADIERQLQQGYDTYRSELARARDRAEQEWNTLRHVIKWLENLLSGQHARKPPTLHGEPIPMGPVSTMPSLLQVPINKLPMNKLGPGITPQTNFQDNVVSIADGYVGQSSGGVPGCSGTGGEWCAMFVNSVLCQALGYTKSQAETEKLLGGGTASVATWANAALTGKPLITGANGEQYKLVPLPAGAAPQPGDLIAYYTPTNGGLPTADTWNLTGPGWHHIGIVKSYSGTSVSAIQGNWGNASLTNYKVRNDPPPLAGNLTSPVSASIDGKQESLATYQRHDGLGWDAIILKLEPVNPPPG
ncbi:MAG: hypothetical protein M1522_08385, partial [Actinobacteria bacterium]|nr:hypothetical protein [Actinomycetota bacterium]